MIKFRVYFVYVLAVIFLTLSARSAYALPFTCYAFAAVPLTVRAEGLAELAGDLVLDCVGGTAGTTFTADLTLFLNTAVTSRILSLPATTEALLLIDEPAPAAQVLNANVFQGLLSAGNSIKWQNIPITQPGDFGHRIIRLTNMRVNATGLTAGPSGFLSPVQGLISSSGSGSIPIYAPTQILAFATKGVDFSASSATFDRALAPGASGNPSQFSITFRELFPTAYKKKIEGSFQNVPGVLYNTESGFTSNATGAAGLADTGTRLVARFSRVPSGVSLSVSTTVTTGTFTAVLMTGTGQDFSGGTPAASGEIGLTGGSGVAVWEITSTNSLSAENITIPVTVSYTPGISGGTALVSGGLGPVSTAAAAGAADPLPRFIDQPAAVAAFHIPPAVPTMNEWGMIFFIILAGLGSVYYLNRQRRTEG